MKWRAFCASALLIYYAGVSCTVEDVILPVEGLPQTDADGPDGETDATDATLDGDDPDAGDATIDADVCESPETAPPVPDDACDMTGLWAVKLVTFSTTPIAPTAHQVSNNWFVLDIVDNGRDIEVLDGFDCGIRVEGTIVVTLPRESTEALIDRNAQDGRSGLFYQDGDECVFEMERHFWVRGAEDRFIPDPFCLYDSDDVLATLDTELPIPTADSPDGAEDWDGDGLPGLAFAVGNETRSVVMRDWNRYFSNDARSIPVDEQDAFIAAAAFDNRENVIACSVNPCGILDTGASPDQEAEHRVVFQRVELDDIEGDTTFDTCINVQELIPSETE